MKTTVGKTALEIVGGSIAGLTVDAIANAANTRLGMGAGVAGAIKVAGGAAIENDAVSRGPIEIGEAVATPGHDLPARWVIHAAVMGEDLATDLEIKVRSQAKLEESLAKLPVVPGGVGAVKGEIQSSEDFCIVAEMLGAQLHAGLRGGLLGLGRVGLIQPTPIQALHEAVENHLAGGRDGRRQQD